MTILQSWKQSLSLFIPRTFVLFLREVGRSIIEVYTLLCTRWMPIVVVISMFLTRYLYTTMFKLDLIESVNSGMVDTIQIPLFLWSIITFIPQMFFLFIVCAAAHSVSNKDNKYFNQFFVQFILLTLVFLGLRELILMLNRGVLFIYNTGSYGIIGSFFLPYTYNLCHDLIDESLWIIFVQFFLDSTGTVAQLGRSALRMLKMVVYNLPFIMILFVAVDLFDRAVIQNFVISLERSLNTSLNTLFTSSFISLRFLVEPLLISLWTVIYTRLKREQPELYRD